jgi:hypothetical protein
MNPLKHMELIFGLVVAAALLLAAAGERDARAAAPRAAGARSAAIIDQPIASAGAMAVVIVKGKRISSREKRRDALSATEPMRIF